MEFIRLELKNSGPSSAELEGHQEIIEGHVKKGCKYLGFIPVKFGPSGKTLAIDLIFEK